ncbi:unnamed protein product [Lepeophtheirus salmonis]|uniref:(salmon louse) hypothetical protein n=1 Tax=Lepeophtheirus salmonis TaxID=72036 RepID=A0A7R8D2N6_LEPSM|nr:unnamed protein product [Lepeophtheirus salmonis]CAF3007344.1 unnamed protein product [Lepeophtheirus salmonis]
MSSVRRHLMNLEFIPRSFTGRIVFADTDCWIDMAEICIMGLALSLAKNMVLWIWFLSRIMASSFRFTSITISLHNSRNSSSTESVDPCNFHSCGVRTTTELIF